MLDLDKTKLLQLNFLLDEFSLQAEEIIGQQVSVKITGLLNPSLRNVFDEDFIIDTVTQAVCNFFNLPRTELTGPSRVSPLPDARGIAYKLIKIKIPNCPYKKIGLHFGGRDHSSVMARIAALTNLMDTEPELKSKYETIKAHLNI